MNVGIRKITVKMAQEVDFSVHWTTVAIRPLNSTDASIERPKTEKTKQTCTNNFGSSDQRASKRRRIETFSPAPALAGIPESTKHDEIT